MSGRKTLQHIRHLISIHILHLKKHIGFPCTVTDRGVTGTGAGMAG